MGSAFFACANTTPVARAIIRQNRANAFNFILTPPKRCKSNVRRLTHKVIEQAFPPVLEAPTRFELNIGPHHPAGFRTPNDRTILPLELRLPDILAQPTSGLRGTGNRCLRRWYSEVFPPSVPEAFRNGHTF